MEPASTRLLKKYWVDELGCSERDLDRGLVVAVPHGSLAVYEGIYFFRRGASLIVSCPSPLLKEVAARMEGRTADEIFEPLVISGLLGERIERTIGPAWIGGISTEAFLPHPSPATRLLGSNDLASISTLFAACDATDVEHSSLEAGRSTIFGTFEGEHLASIAGYERLFGTLAHIGVLVHPSFRGKGLATASVSRATNEALKEELGIQYQTLSSNLPSIRAAKRLGYSTFGETIAARLKR